MRVIKEILKSNTFQKAAIARYFTDASMGGLRFCAYEYLKRKSLMRKKLRRNNHAELFLRSLGWSLQAETIARVCCIPIQLSESKSVPSFYPTIWGSSTMLTFIPYFLNGLKFSFQFAFYEIFSSLNKNHYPFHHQVNDYQFYLASTIAGSISSSIFTGLFTSSIFMPLTMVVEHYIKDEYSPTRRATRRNLISSSLLKSKLFNPKNFNLIFLEILRTSLIFTTYDCLRILSFL